MDTAKTNGFAADTHHEAVRIYEALRKGIFRGEILPGDELNQVNISQQYGEKTRSVEETGRTSARPSRDLLALQRLAPAARIVPPGAAMRRRPGHYLPSPS
ncbi:hypothetical protein [Pigmentiphaga sp.]|uniref:hypothetical protein n=1 Tax=Pigmentiphaga sp. TaxID=1977564 RepID=UPI0025F199B5|nr:hypothetical protein [Pigmentiphaga sp.]MBX6319738.1 hypothetical protein [Pigmentiphaga sp.]